MKTATTMIEKWFDHHFSSFFESVLPKNSKSCPADHQRDRPRTSNLIKRLTEMIEKWFDHHFSSFFQGYSLRHKKSALTLAVDQRTWRIFFPKIFKKKFNKSTAPRKHKIKRLRSQSHSQLIIKGTFRHGKRILKFVITMIDKLFDHHFSSFFQGYSLWHKKNQPWPWRWNKKYEDFFSKLFNKNFNKCPAPRKHKIKRLKNLSPRQLITKAQERKLLKFFILYKLYIW